MKDASGEGGREKEDPIGDSTLYLGCVGERVHNVDQPFVVTNGYLDI